MLLAQMPTANLEGPLQQRYALHIETALVQLACIRMEFAHLQKVGLGLSRQRTNELQRTHSAQGVSRLPMPLSLSPAPDLQNRQRGLLSRGVVPGLAQF